ncbi:MAG: glycerophosphodiester phosphodiesterase [Solirubrobacteraceae bacterium]|jgi:glycerophosphoryl diester phosphodiesterase
MSALIRVGHKGAAALAPGNTLASFDAALAAGVDMIEFDVLAGSRRGGEIYVAHDAGALDLRDPLTLAAALAHLSTPPFSGIRLQLDLKSAGSEERVIDALGRSDALDRAFISTGRRRVLERVRELAPALQLGWTVPGIPGVSGTPLLTPTLGRLYRRLLPHRAAAHIQAGAIDALVPHWRLVSRELVEAVRGAGGELYAWTVDDAGEIARLAALGVSGVITNDPRLFA